MPDPRLEFALSTRRISQHHEVAIAQDCLHDMRSESGRCETGVPCLGRTFEADLVAELEEWLDRTNIWPLSFIVGLAERIL